MGSISRHEKRFIARLPRVREIRGMTQQELADAAGIGRSSLGMIEIDRRGVQLGEAVDLCDALNVPLADMISADPLTLTIETHVD